MWQLIVFAALTVPLVAAQSSDNIEYVTETETSINFETQTVTTSYPVTTTEVSTDVEVSTLVTTYGMRCHRCLHDSVTDLAQPRLMT